MSALITVDAVSKAVGAQRLFEDLRLSIEGGAVLGLIGANGSGKSTLLRMIAGFDEPDSGAIYSPPGLAVQYVQQAADFGSASTVEDALKLGESSTVHFSDATFQKLLSRYTALFELPKLETPLAAEQQQHLLSGGELKRIQLTAALCSDPDLLLLDEPTNHLDIRARETLESIIEHSTKTWIIVSHDRWLLQSVCDYVMELAPGYPQGALLVEGNYREFQKRKELFRQEQAAEAQRMKSQARREQAWLLQGAKARSTKSKQRTAAAHELLQSLRDIRSRDRVQVPQFAFDTSANRSKELIVLDSISHSFGNRKLFDSLSLTILRGSAWGILGANGSGKTTLLRLMQDQLQATEGRVQRKQNLQLRSFSQQDPYAQSADSLHSFFAPDGDSVSFRNESIHVASWAKRFGFRHEQLSQPLRALSGGERARARLAKLLLEPADVLILDEPTNDLDIPTLEILEESLLSFEGALVLVSHDRYFLSRVCSDFLGQNANGRWTRYAEIAQWLEDDRREPHDTSTSVTTPDRSTRSKSSSRRLSYLEQREYDSIEVQIAAAEATLAARNLELQNVSPGDPQFSDLCQQLSEDQRTVESLYQRWEELEKKLQGEQR